MPLFEFECSCCEHVFEELVFSDEKPTCPKCHSEKTEKLISKPCRNRSSHTNIGDYSSVGQGSTHTSSACSGCAGGSCSTCGN